MWQQASKTTPGLATTRLRLRPIGLQDSQAFYDIYSDAETLRFWSDAPITEYSEAESLVQKELDWSAAGQCINWGIALPESDFLIGKFTLFQHSEQNRRAEVGYLLNRRYWGQGYMSEVMRCAINYAFDVVELHRLEADTDPQNVASLALLEKFGFRREGFFRERWLVCDKWLDSVMLGLLKQDYSRLKY